MSSARLERNCSGRTCPSTRLIQPRLSCSGGVFCAESQAAMSMVPTRQVDARTAKDLADTLARLRIARIVGDASEARVSTRRLDWLLDCLPKGDAHV